FLDRRGAPVRVVLTGRSLDAVEWSGFLRPETAILGMRRLTPAQLDQYLDNIYDALTEDLPEVPAHWAGLADKVDFAALLERYEKDYEQAQEKVDWGELGHGEHGSLEVLGQPLLVYLTLRLMAQWHGELGPMQYDATTMYRSLFELAVGEQGELHGVDSAARVLQQARRDLRAIAVAMTVRGREWLSYQ